MVSPKVWMMNFHAVRYPATLHRPILNIFVNILMHIIYWNSLAMQEVIMIERMVYE